MHKADRLTPFQLSSIMLDLSKITSRDKLLIETLCSNAHISSDKFNSADAARFLSGMAHLSVQHTELAWGLAQAATRYLV